MKWEYQLINSTKLFTSNDPQSALNFYGQEGWEVSTFIDFSDGWIVLKRRIQESKKSQDVK